MIMSDRLLILSYLLTIVFAYLLLSTNPMSAFSFIVLPMIALLFSPFLALALRALEIHRRRKE